MPITCCSASHRVLCQELTVHDLFREMIEIGVTHVIGRTSALTIPLGFERQLAEHVVDQPAHLADPPRSPRPHLGHAVVDHRDPILLRLAGNPPIEPGGVPGLIASATELVIAFVMGLGGTIKYAWGGFVDIRLAMIILGGSLFGIQLGAIGTTYVKPYMVKVVMGVIMILVLFSRGVAIPVYLSDLNLITPMASETGSLMKNISFGMMIFALLVGAFIVLRALIKGMLEHRRELAAPEHFTPSSPARPRPVAGQPCSAYCWWWTAPSTARGPSMRRSNWPSGAAASCM